MKEVKKFKIRCSAIGQIMGEPRNKKDREAGLLSQTAKTYCEKWLKEQLYNKRKNISSKYFTKGNIVEQDSLDFIADQLGLGMLLKNEVRKSNEYMEGECDAIITELIIDAKNSWDHDTFPLFATEPPDTNNVWQLQGYLELFDRPKGKVIYVLSDTPEHLIRKEAYYHCRDLGYEELDDDIFDKFLANMTYGDVPDNLKIKIFSFDRNQEDIEKIKQQVGKCRIYIKELLKLI